MAEMGISDLEGKIERLRKKKIELEKLEQENAVLKSELVELRKMIEGILKEK